MRESGLPRLRPRGFGFRPALVQGEMGPMGNADDEV